MKKHKLPNNSTLFMMIKSVNFSSYTQGIFGIMKKRNDKI